MLQSRLSFAALADLLTLTSELGVLVQSNNAPDKRVCRLTANELSNKDFYSNSFRHLQVDDLAQKVWKSAAPLKCRIFCWLAKRKRLPTNERRFRHRLSDSAMCPSCALPEDVDHLLLSCHRAREVWRFFQMDFADQAPFSLTDLLRSSFSSFEASTITTAIAWNIWKRRNSLVFNSVDETLHVISQRCIKDLKLWASRCHSAPSASVLNNWCLRFDPP
jgi:hypothetical protein